MKHSIFRSLCLLLAAVLLLCSILSPAFGEELSDEALIAKYRIPNNWARPALLFAVRNGLLSGTDEGLCPEKNITRAEVAAIMMQIIRTSAGADLSGFRDVSPNAWYYSAVSRAFAAGVLSGSGNGLMRPTANITREEAFAIISSTIGLTGGTAEDLNDFIDGGKVSTWARDSMMRMIRAGHVSGSAGYLNPQKNITRQEFVQVLYSIFDGLGTSISGNYSGTFALAADTVPSRTVVDGDLIIFSEAPNILLDGITVKGRLVIQGSGKVSLQLNNCKLNTLVLCRQSVVSAAGSSATRISVLSNSTVNMDCQALEVWSDTVFSGNAHSAAVVKGSLSIKNGSVGKTYSADVYRTAQSLLRVRIQGKLFRDAVLYSRYETGACYDPIRTYPAQTTFTLLAHRGVSVSVRLSDGTEGLFYISDMYVFPDKYYTNTDYSVSVKECYVNYLGRYTSSTDYLMWINRWTIKVNVFTGGDGHWDLKKTFDCAIGENLTPTEEGIFPIRKKTAVEYSQVHHYYYYNVSWFGANAFHTRLYNPDGTFYDPSIHDTVSGGCIRMYDEDAIWIYNTIPMSTAVVVY